MKLKTQRLLVIGLLGILAVSANLSPRAEAALRTWTGAAANDSRWTTANNWSNGPPVAGDDLLFPGGAAHPNNNNDYAPGTTFNSIIFSGTNYSIGGSSLALNAGIIATNVGAANTVNNALVLNSNQTFTVSIGNANFSFFGPIDTSGKDLTFAVTAPSLAPISAGITGTGGLIKTGSGTVSLNVSNSFSGTVQLNEGFINISDGSSLGSTSSSTTVANGASLILLNSITVAEPLVLSGTLRTVGSSTNTWTGPITLASAGARIVSDTSSQLIINAVITGTNGFSKGSPGALTLNSNNTYTGTTVVSNGTLIVNGNQPDSAIVFYQGTVGGKGAVGTITAGGNGGKTLSPGHNGPGILTCNNLALDILTALPVELNGTAPGAGYDQLNVNGTVLLNNPTLSVTLGFTPAPSDTFVIINNDGTDAISGIFAGLPQNALLTNGATIFRFSYAGGDGDDVTLTTTLGAPSSTLTSIVSLTNGFALLTGQGQSNLTYAVQAATNLAPPTVRTPLGGAAADASGVYQFTDTNAPSFPVRFYRSVSP
ncbi:MAG: hypothetical protein HY298_21185 [Verrucomicrobia bacterium]|nr:hypothetical protein [Verrucomicrobiota bacterium]